MPDQGYDPRKLSEPNRDRRPSVTVTSPGSPENYRGRSHSPSIAGKIQVFTIIIYSMNYNTLYLGYIKYFI